MRGELYRGDLVVRLFFIKTMARFTDLLSEKGKQNWPEIYKQLTGKKWIPPKKDKRGIQCETKIEEPEEIAKLMKQKPGYSVDKQGREG